MHTPSRARSRSVKLCGREIERPGHVCAFFNSREEEYAALLPYLRQGIDAGEEVVSVIDASRVEDHRTRLRSAGLAPDAPGFSVSTSEETYLAAGRFDMERMEGFVRGALESARGRGCCVRTAGWMDWVHREAPGTDRAMEYEARMNLLVPEFDCTFLCIYDMSKLSGNMVVDIMTVHPWVILNGRIRENSFYVPPEIYLSEVFASQPRLE
ncbi:MAG TPA: MEDS domain-containing protein [Gemmatimonadaceae bacterium]|nr:MEDS domain-containing protein [Gemmatimonadaceae bacterium]